MNHLRQIQKSLLNLSTRYRHDDNRTVNTENDEHELSTISTLNQEPQQSKIKSSEILLENCSSLSEILQFFESDHIKEELKKADKVLVLRIQIDDKYFSRIVKEIQKLSSKCQNNSILIYICTKNGENYKICWKSASILKFLTFLPYMDIPLENKKITYDFLAEFIVESLKNRHLGLQKCIKNFDGGLHVQFHHFADSREFNLLLIATEKNRDDIMKILLNQKIESICQVNGQKVNAIDLAWKNKCYKAQYALLQHNLPFPSPFDINQCSEEIKGFVKTTEELHEAISKRNEEKIMEILKQAPNQRHFYSTSNVSAAKHALNLKFIDAYKLLVMNKVFLGHHETFTDLWENFNSVECEDLKEIHFKNSIHLPEKHLSLLNTNSSISHDDPNAVQNHKLVQRSFNFLNMIPQIRTILMVVAASKIFDIVFDFNRDSVHVLDPTDKTKSKGLFYTVGRIYIAAYGLLKSSTEHETFGTLAHEFCHYAIKLVYKNKAKPYSKKDKMRMKEFEQIFQICEQNRHKEKIIELVFNYPPKEHHAELIVRVPHLLAMYYNQPEKLTEVRINFKELFDYYETKVLADMEKAHPKIEAENKIEAKNNRIFWYKVLLAVGLVLGAIVSLVMFFVLRSIFFTPTFVFSTLSESDKNIIWNAPISYKNTELKFIDLFEENSTAYEKLTSNHISQMLDGKILNLNNSHFHYLNELIVHDWDRMTEKLKKKVLHSNFLFQNESLMMQKLNIACPVVLNYLTTDQINDLLNGNELKIGNIILSETKFFMERKFHVEDIFKIYWSYMNYVTNGKTWKTKNEDFNSNVTFEEFYDEFLAQNFIDYSNDIAEIGKKDFYRPSFFKISKTNTLLTNKKYKLGFNEIFDSILASRAFILSSEAGAGKTVTFEMWTMEIKKKYPMWWVSYIDLKDFTNYYNKNGSLTNVEDLLENILGLGSQNEFERQIFQELFKSGNVILLFNGFDEISPDYSEFILNVLSSIKTNTKNIQFVCTRPLYSESLKERLEVIAYELVPLDITEQHALLQKYFIAHNIHISQIYNYMEKVIKVINASKSDWNLFQKDQDFDTPLILNMIAELVTIDTEIFKNENLYQIYERFVRKKIEIWQTRNQISQKIANELIASANKFSIIKIFQKYALKTISGLNEISRLKVMHQKVPKEITNAEISRMGILYINGDDYYKLAHKTFEEFFIAQYIIDNIYNSEDVNEEEAKLRLNLLYYISYEYFQNQVIIKFLNYYLEIQDATETEAFVPNIANIFMSDPKKYIFDIFIRNPFLNTYSKSKLLTFLFNFYMKDYKCLNKLLLIDENETIYSASFNYFYSTDADHFLNLERAILSELGRKHLIEEELEKFIHGKNQKGVILLSQFLTYMNYHTIITHDKYNLIYSILLELDVKILFTYLKSELTQDETNELYTSKSSPFYHTDISENGNICNEIENFSTKENFKIFLFNKIDTFMSYSRSNLEIFSYYLVKMDEYLTDTEIYNFFMSTNCLSNIYLYLDFVKLWDFLKNRTNETQQRTILLYQNKRSTISIFAKNIVSNDIESSRYKYISEIYEKLFDKTELQHMILDYQGFLNDLMDLHPDAFPLRFSYLVKIFEGNEKKIREFLLSKINSTSEYDLTEINYRHNFEILSSYTNS